MHDTLSKLPEQENHCHILQFVSEQGWGFCRIDQPFHNLEVGTLQIFLDDYIDCHPGVEIDYIHGAEVVTDLGSKTGILVLFATHGEERFI